MNFGNGKFRVFTASPLNTPSHIAFLLSLTFASGAPAWVIGEHYFRLTSRVSTIIVFDLESAGEIWRWQGKGVVNRYIALPMGNWSSAYKFRIGNLRISCFILEARRCAAPTTRIQLQRFRLDFTQAHAHSRLHQSVSLRTVLRAPLPSRIGHSPRHRKSG